MRKEWVLIIRGMIGLGIAVDPMKPTVKRIIGTHIKWGNFWKSSDVMRDKYYM